MTAPAKRSARDRRLPRLPAGLRTGLKLALGVGLAAFLGHLFLAGSDLGGLTDAVRAADPGLVTLALLSATAGFFLRAVRWRAYLRPVKQVELRSSFDILMIGYLCSAVLPGRIGDFVVRPAMMARSERIPVAATLATIAVERLFDLLMVLLCFAAYLVWFAPAELDIDLTAARYAGWMLLAAAVYSVRLLYGLSVERERCMALLARLTRPFPARFRGGLMRQAASFADGLDLFRDRKNALATIVYSALAWSAVALSLWLVARSLDLAVVRPADALFLTGLGALGVAVPVPGGVGSFHLLMFEGLKGLGVASTEVGQAAAILMWGLTIVPIAVLGVASVLHRGVRFTELRRAMVEGTPTPLDGDWEGDPPVADGRGGVREGRAG